MRTNSPYQLGKQKIPAQGEKKDQLIRAESPKIYPSIYASLVYDKGAI